MATRSGGYLPLSTVSDKNDQDDQDIPGYGSGSTVVQELRSYFLNRREFPALYPANSIVLIVGETGLNRFSLVEEVCKKMSIVCFHVCSPPGSDNSSYIGGQEALLEYFLSQAEKLSAEKEVVLYFDEAEIGLIGRIKDIPTKISLVGAVNSSESLDSAVLSKVSKYINIPPPDLNERLRFLKQKIKEANFINKIGEKELEFIGLETEKYSYRDLQRLWYQSCDILLSQLRNAGQVKNKDEQAQGDMKMTGDIMVRALSAVSNSVHHKMIGENDYLKKLSDFVNKKENLITNVVETNRYPTTKNFYTNSNQKSKEFEWEGMLMRKHEWCSTTKKASDRSWDRVYVVVKGPQLFFYSDQTVYKTTGETFRGEKPLSLTGGSADGAADYDKKIHVFRVSLSNGGSYLFQAQDDQQVNFLVNNINQQAQLLGEEPGKALLLTDQDETEETTANCSDEYDCECIFKMGMGALVPILFIVGVIILLTLKKPKWGND